MDCIYLAWCDHARWLGVRPSRLAYPLFRSLYDFSNGNEGMYGGCVPLTIQLLNLTSGLRISRIQHHPFFDRATFVAGAETTAQRIMSRLSDFGEKNIGIGPAIYLLLSRHHAEFLLASPPELAVLAVQLERRDKCLTGTLIGEQPTRRTIT